jgi:short-subunit dehydrogenase
MTIAWITGGGTGIGRALAERLYREGAKVVISGRRQEILDRTVAEITSKPGPGQLLAIAGDASNSFHAKDVVSRAAGRWGTIDLLINNAGANSHETFAETTFEDYQKAFEMNGLTAIRATQAVLPVMRQTNRGAIVNISSIYGKWASSGSASYSVGKHALAAYTDALRQDLIGSRIHVMGVFPGFIKTDMTMPFVRPGSIKAGFGKTPDQMAGAILKALSRRKRELYYPWYVPWVLRFHRWMPRMSDRLAARVRR